MTTNNSIGLNIELPIYNSNGSSFHGLVLHKCTYDSVVMSLGDKITGDVYYNGNTLAVTMQEYVELDGVKFVLVTPPTVVREGMVSENSQLNGMTKYSFVFYHPMYMLGNFPFTDVAVTSSEAKYLSESKKFTWIGYPDDFIAKVNKNLDGTEWIVEKSSRFPAYLDDQLSEVLSFDGNTIADACKTFYDTWGAPYIVAKVESTEAAYANGKRFKVIFGLPSNEIYEDATHQQSGTPYIFRFGKGVGLKNNSRTPRGNKIVTRIAGSGSENNIPYGYPQIPWYGDSRWDYTEYEGDTINYDSDGHVTNTPKTTAYPLYMGIVGGAYVKLIKHPFTRTTLMPSIYGQTLFNKVSPYLSDGTANPDYDPNTTLIDYYDAIATQEYPYPNPIVSNAPSYESHQFEDIKPELGQNVAIIDAYPVNKDMTPAQAWDDSMDDDGNYVQSYFKMQLPVLSFDLYACAAITQEMQINMRGGACLGCTFTIQVDWDDYKRNFYDSDGNFAPTGSQRDYTKYPDSSQEQITVVLQKETATFGTLMPNMYQYPVANDTFVVLGISLPLSYIESAEERLDGEMKSYMLENNVHYFDYPLKFDEAFLRNNPYILSQIRPNSVVRFQYGNDTMQLFVKQMSVKYGEGVLPKYDITLTDNVEVVLNRIGQVAEDVEKLASLIAILRQNYNRSVWNELAKKLSKTQDDTAAGYITMLKGLQVGANFVPDILGEGGVLRMRDDGKVELVTDILYARMRAYFDSVVIREYRHESGNRIKSPAQGFNASRVEYIKVVDNVETIVDDASEADYFRCYWRVDDGEKKAENQFIIGDLAFCENSDIVNGSLVTKRYWRVVTGRNAGNTTTADGEAWIDLSNAHDTNGNPMMTTISWEGQGGTTQTLSVKSFESSANSYPEAHDDICMLGCTTDTTRQGAIIEYVSGVDAPTYQIYQGLGADATNPYSLSGKNQIGFGYSTSTGKAYMNVYGDAYIGDRNRNTFLEYKQNGAGGNPELNIKAKIQILPNGSTIDGESISDYIKDNQNNYDDTEVQQAISDLNDAVGNLQDQIDGSIETLYGDVDPSVPANDPYKDYTTDEKEKHLGDMYYNSTTGYAYRYDKTVSGEGEQQVTTYFWQIIRDTGITQAIADAAAALGLADTKAKIFTTTAGTLPTPPYKINDVWVNATYPANGSTYSNEILKCVTARAQGATANIADWAKASKYTDDSSLQNFISATYDPTIAGLTEQVDRKIESWFQSTDPSDDWYDDTQTPVLDVRADHVGDMWYSESTHLLKRYDSETTGEGEQAVTTYFWTTIQDQKAIDAYDNAAHAQDTADGKRRVFTAQPVAADAYDVGDLWVNATYPATGTKTYENDVLRCKTAKAAGVAFNISHWQKASKYTDDTALTNFINGDYANTIGALEGQLDKKAETWYQSANPADDWYVVDPETQEVTTDTRADHVGDLWYKTSDNTTWYYKRSGAGTEQDPYTYAWEQQNVPLAVFDKIDGKADIFVSKPSTYNKYDMWIIESGLAAADMPAGCQSGDIVIAKNKRTNSYTKGDWEKKDRYTDDSAFNGYISAFLSGSGASGDSAVAAAIQKAIAGALGSGTVVDGGLLLSSLIGMRKYKGSGSVTELSSYDTWGGISGEYNDDDETVEGGAKGHGIAAWYGGDMVDKEMLSDEEIANGWGTGEGQYRWAKSVDRFDGSGYRADGNITWDEQGRVSIKDVTTIISSNNTDVLNELITFNNAFHFNLSQGTSTVLSIEPQAAFTNLYIRNTTNPNAPYHVATEKWVDDHYVSTAYFRQLFRAFKPNETAGQADVEVQPNTIDATISNIKAMVGFWTEQYVSALGQGSDGGGGGGASVLYGLNDVSPNATGDGVLGAQDGYVLTYNGSTHHWYAAATAETYVLPTATANALGGIKIGYAASGKNYAIALDTNGKAYVNVPWTDTTYTLAGLMGSTAIGGATQPIYWNGSAFANTTYTLAKSVPADAKFTDTTYSFSNADATLAWSTRTKIATTGGTDIYVTLPTNPDTWRNIFLDGTEELTTGINTKGLNFVGDGKTTISFLAAGTEEGQSGNAEYATLKISSTWRGMKNNLTTSSSNTTDSLSAYQGYLLANGSARDNTKLPLTGGTLTGNLTINPSSGSKYIQIGTIRIGYDSDNNALKVYKVETANNVETEVAANFYALGAISALGQGVDGGGGGGQGDVTWALLADGTDTRQIALSHLTTALAGYSTTSHTHTTTIAAGASGDTNQLTLAYGTKYKLTAGGTSFIFTMPSADDTWRNIYVAGTQQITTAVNTKGLNFAAGSNVSLSFAAAGTGSGQSGNANYGTLTISATDTTYSAGTGLSLSNGTFSLSSTYQTYVSHGESAYNSLSNYLPLSGGTIASDNFAPFFIQRNHTTNIAAMGFKHYSSGTTVEIMGYIGMNTKNGALLRLDSSTANTYTILDTSNSSVSKSEDTLTVKINGTTQSLTNTNTTYSAGAGLRLNDTEFISDCPRVSKDSKVGGGWCTWIMEEYTASANYNLPSNAYYHIMSTQGDDITYETQLALGMTTDGVYYRRNNGGSWGDWKSLVNTWRGIQDNLTSDSTTDSLSANQGKTLKGYTDTLFGYFTEGVANSAAKLTTVSKTAWGQTFWTSGGVPTSISGNMTNVGNISFSATGKNIGSIAYFDTTNSRLGIGTSSPSYKLHVDGTFYASGNSSVGGTFGVTGATTLTGLLTANGGIVIASSKTLKIGDIYLAYDSTNNAIEVYKLDGTNHVAANLYARGGIAALGETSDGGGGGGQGDVTWDLLSRTAIGGRFIDSSYISGTLANYLPLSGGTMTGVLTLPANLYNGYEASQTYAINANNSDIVNVNSILTSDVSGSWKDSIGFKRTNGNWDTFRAADGTFYFGVDSGTEYTALHSGNSSVSKSGETLTVKINGTSYSLTNTNTTYSAGAGIRLNDTTIISNALRVNKDSKAFGGYCTWIMEEYVASSSHNLPSNAYYHIMSTQGDDTTYGTQLALGMTTEGVYYRRYNGGSWGDWKSLINTDTTYSANNGVGLSGTTFYNSGVRATTINGNYLRVNTNGTNADLTIPYASSAGSVAWGNITSKPNLVSIGSDGVSEVGQYMDFHYGSTTSDYSARLDVTADSQVVVHLPTSSGTLALYSQIPINNNQLTNGAGYVTSSGVTSLTMGTGLTGGTITSTGTISINSTYQTYISHGESAYNSLGNYLPLIGGTLYPSSGDTPLTLRSRTAGCWLEYKNADGNTIGYYGFVSGVPVVSYGSVSGMRVIDSSLIANMTYNVKTSGYGKFNSIEIGAYNGTAHSDAIEKADGPLWINYYSGNNVAIGQVSSIYKLNVAGDIYATGGVTSLSDIRKKDVVSYNLPLNVTQIANAPTIKFLWKDKREEGEQIGTIAQYWQKVLPWVVKDKSNELSMQYGVTALIASITTARKVVDHEKRITELERENKELREEICRLKIA